MPKAKELLASKKGHEREGGVLVLSLIDDPEAKKTLRELLDTEKDGRIRASELIGAARWTGGLLKNADELMRSSDTLDLAAIDANARLFDDDHAPRPSMPNQCEKRTP